ncbi:hypothetical protein ACFV6M_11370 [Streptomyces californicus]|uniref:hypothetical protein n=1 Tax=Streptomyces TaxID=1883 RepID=UPI0015C4D80B|nr:hypothetical protein [Streptomyces sp. CB04723]QLG33443.1 hypothetical protein HXS80_18520 [Streptomyces sp. CB04723]
MSRSPLSDPLETVLSWIWALGTASGLVAVGLLAHTEHSSASAPSAQPTLSVEDVPSADGTV